MTTFKNGFMVSVGRVLEQGYNINDNNTFSMHRAHDTDMDKGVADSFRDWFLGNGFTPENAIAPDGA